MQHDSRKRKQENTIFTDAALKTLSGTLALIGILGIMHATRSTETGKKEDTSKSISEPHKYPYREHYRKVTTYETHEVSPGETLSGIAEKYNVKVEDIVNANRNTIDPDNINLIQTGISLRIPIEKTILVEPKKQLNEDLMRGIDISHYQGNIDWNKLEKAYKNGEISYIIIRICENINDNMERKFTLDERFEEYLSECNKRGIPYGIYAFSRGTSKEELDQETTSLIDYIKNNLNQQKDNLDLTFNPSLPIYMDCFDDTNGAQYRLMAEGRYDECANIIDYWCTNMENAGFFTGVYINNGHYNNLMNTQEGADTLNKYSVWVAEYPSTEETNVKEYTELSVPLINTIHGQQVSSKGKIDGIDGHVDVNILSRGLQKQVLDFYKKPKVIKRRVLR